MTPETAIYALIAALIAALPAILGVLRQVRKDHSNLAAKNQEVSITMIDRLSKRIDELENDLKVERLARLEAQKEVTALANELHVTRQSLMEATEQRQDRIKRITELEEEVKRIPEMETQIIKLKDLLRRAGERIDELEKRDTGPLAAQG